MREPGRHGIEDLRFGDNVATLIAEAIDPATKTRRLLVRSDSPFLLVIEWGNDMNVLHIPAGETTFILGNGPAQRLEPPDAEPPVPSDKASSAGAQPEVSSDKEVGAPGEAMEEPEGRTYRLMFPFVQHAAPPIRMWNVIPREAR